MKNTERSSWKSSLLDGYLVGSLFALAQFIVVHEDLLSIPVSGQFRYTAITVYSYSLVGLGAVTLYLAATALLGRRVRLITEQCDWPPAAAVALCVGAGVVVLEESLAGAAYSVFATLVVFLASCWITRSYSQLRNSYLWPAATLAITLAVLAWMLGTGPAGHGASWFDTALLAPVVLVPAARLWFLLRKDTRRWRQLLVYALPLLGLGMMLMARTPSTGESAPATPNLVIITIDTLRADYLGSYGNTTINTPAIDGLAGQGVLFENVIAPMPLTNPSHTSIMTGLYPASHGVLSNKPIPMASHVLSLPEILSRFGYKTAAFVSGYPLGKEIAALRDDFEVYEDDLSLHPKIPAAVHKSTLTRNIKTLLRGELGTSRLASGFSRKAEQTMNAVADWLDLNSQSRFLLWVHLYDPHEIYNPPAPYDRMYDPDYVGPVTGRWEALSLEERELLLANPDDVEHMKALYAGEVSYVDEQVGWLLAQLERHGLTDQTLVVFTADHGECLTEHNIYFGHSACLADAALKVPMIVRFPDGRGSDTRITGLMELTDIFPTLLEYLEMPVPDGLDGRSVMGSLGGDEPHDTDERVAISAIFEGEVAGGKRAIAVRTQDYKYIWNSAFWADMILIPESEEFYDLASDPQETQNLYSHSDETAASYRKIADKYRDEWSALRSAKKVEISEQEMEALRALGYIE
jgi:arylsulfatase A-like enzyme